MKTISVILAVVLVFTNALEDEDVLKQWNQFQATFGKSYRSPLEARKRLGIFQDNLKVMEAHNILFEKGQTSFTMGVNQFSDWTDSEFESFVKKGLINETQSFATKKSFARAPNFVAPASVDWRNEGIVTPVKDQGSCSGCWAFSATGAIEGQLGLVNGMVTSLSEQDLIDCSKKVEKNNGCGGGLMTLAFDYVIRKGIDSEEDYPFKGHDEWSCRDNEYTPVTKLSSYVNIEEGNEADLQAAIASNGPVSIGIDASTDFHHYKSGIFDGSCQSERKKMNHAVLAVGYGSENGKNFYIIKNSWATTWGEEGYIRIARDEGNKCGVATMATYPVL